jgi:hypothetical protein
MTNSAASRLANDSRRSPALSREFPASAWDTKGLTGSIISDALVDAKSADLTKLVQLKHPAILLPRIAKDNGAILFPSVSICPYSRPTTLISPNRCYKMQIDLSKLINWKKI